MPARDRFERAVESIDAANAADPNVVVQGGSARPKELVHAELMTDWVSRLDPDADEAQLLAARAHHLRRWVVPRSEYPEGRAGYLRWRRAAGRRQADEVGALLVAVGYDDELIRRVQRIVRKEGLGRDPAVQVHEDALCLVFLTNQLGTLIADLGEEKASDVLARTVRKMGPQGRTAAAGLDLPPDQAALVRRVLQVGSVAADEEGDV